MASIMAASVPLTELEVPANFKDAYSKFLAYPTQLTYTTTYASELENYKTRLDLAANKLFLPSEKGMDVGFRDFDNDSGNALNAIDTTNQDVLCERLGNIILRASNVKTKAALRDWLGDKSSIDRSNQRVGSMITKRDPKCRFIFFWAEHSQSRLWVTKELFLQTLSYHQVMPSYLEFVSCFGQSSKKRDLRFSGFRQHIFPLSDSSSTGPAALNLSRSGRCYQMSYNLKTCIDATEPVKPEPLLREHDWHIRQAAFHHQFDVGTGVTLWITTSGHSDVQKCVQELTGRRGKPRDRAFSTVEECFSSSLAVHLRFCHWSTQNWRDYLRWLEDVIEDETSLAVLGSRDPGSVRRVFTAKDVQRIQEWRDKVNEVVMVAEANTAVMNSLRGFYEDLLKNIEFPLRDSGKGDIDSFTTQINYMAADLRLQITRAKLLERITGDRKDLVVQHLQGQASEKMEFLVDQSQREAIAMRVIAVVTIFFLPATFVSTFFSTDIVKYQDPQGGPPNNGKFSVVAMTRWLELTLPLTAITVLVGISWYAIANSQRRNWHLNWEKSFQLPKYHWRGKII